jgi:hypothetical protein
MLLSYLCYKLYVAKDFVLWTMDYMYVMDYMHIMELVYWVITVYLYLKCMDQREISQKWKNR